MGERETGFVYFIGAFDGGYLRAVKIGWTKHPDMRLSDLQTGNHGRLSILAAREGTRDEERSLHRRFAYTVARRDIKSEWFSPTIEMVELLRQLGSPVPIGDESLVKDIAESFAWLIARRDPEDIEVDLSRRAFELLR